MTMHNTMIYVHTKKVLLVKVNHGFTTKTNKQKKTKTWLLYLNHSNHKLTMVMIH